MSWPRALAAWLLIVAAETVHGTLRQQFLAPTIGDLRARQVEVLRAVDRARRWDVDDSGS